MLLQPSPVRSTNVAQWDDLREKKDLFLDKKKSFCCHSAADESKRSERVNSFEGINASKQSKLTELTGFRSLNLALS
jgi:hypothetical protein